MSAAGLGLLASKLARGAGRFMHPLGAQLYTVRNIMPTAAEPTLKSIEIGYREVETDHASLPRIAPILNNYGLKPVSCHFETPLITGNWKIWKSLTNQGATWSQAIEDAKKFGAEYMVMPISGRRSAVTWSTTNSSQTK
jgi:sugar phosphate isomerase/epimerase